MKDVVVWSAQPLDAQREASLRVEIRSCGWRLSDLSIGAIAAARRQIFLECPAAVIVISSDPADILELRSLKSPIVWDAAGASFEGGDGGAASLSSEQTALMARALSRCDQVVNASAALCEAVETELNVGVPQLTVSEGLIQLEAPVAVAVGSGLGNMLNATPLVRWLAETTGRRVTVIINGELAQGVQLFSGSPFVGFVFPGFEYTAGRHYSALVQTAISAHLEPMCTADRWIQQHKQFDYNIEGRFIREADVFFLGLEGAFPGSPSPGDALPLPFVRNLEARPEHDRVIGLANGIKTGVWSKRQWDKTAQLAERLAGEGWTLRCFGMPEELVPHTEDYTGLSIRRTAEEIARCAYFIGHDGGMCHLAEKLGVPTLWLFGPTGRRKNGRWFEHSINLISGAACSPCNFKSDWLRCEEPVCMTELSVEDVATAFEQLRAKARTTPSFQWARVDEADLLQELTVVDRPARGEGATREALERIAALPAGGSTPIRLMASLLRFGDLDGAAGLASSLMAAGQPEPATGVICQAVLAVARPDAQAVQSREILQALGEIIGLDLAPADLRAIMECFAQAFWISGQKGAMPELFERLARRASGPLGNWAIRRWVGVMAIVDPAQMAGRTAELLIPARPHQATTNLLRRAIQGEEWVARAREGREGGGSMPLAPARAGLGLQAGPDLELPLPDGTITLPRWTTIAIVAPSIDPTLKRPGSAAGLVLATARAMASLGFCPLIATPVQASDRPVLELRDNVSFINGSSGWSPEVWQVLIDGAKPGLVISLDGAAEALGLAGEVTAYGLDGLYDRLGLADIVGDELSLDFTAPPSGLPPFDGVLRALQAGTPVLAPKPRGKARTIAVLVNDYRDRDLAVQIARLRPDLQFKVAGDTVSRSIERNLSFLPRKSVQDWGGLMESVDALLPLTSISANHSAEVLDAIIRTVPVLLFTDLTTQLGASSPEADLVISAQTEKN